MQQQTPPLPVLIKTALVLAQLFLSVFFKYPVKSLKCNKCRITSFFLSLGLQHRAALVSMPFSVSSDVYRDPKKNCTCTLYLGPRGQQNLQLSSQQEASQRFCHLQKQQRCHAIGFTVDQWEGGIGGVCCEKLKRGCKCEGRTRKGMGIWLWCLMFWHCAWEQEWIKEKIYQWESEHVWKMCLPQPFHLLHRGGYSHCLEVFSCVPLGPTRRLVTHLKVSFSVVQQHHLKD